MPFDGYPAASLTQACERRDSGTAKPDDQSASGLFARKGFAQVGMRELASCLGLAPGSLYHHYPSKRHLLLDILEEFYEELMAALASVESRGADSIGEVIRAHVRLHQELPRHFSIALRDSGCLSVEQQQRVECLRAEYEARLLDVLYHPRLHDQALSANVGCIIASLLGIVHSWFSVRRLQDSATSRRMEVALVVAIERLLVQPATD